MKNEEWIREELNNLKESDLLREAQCCEPSGGEISIGGKIYINFSSNNYLNLSNESSIIKRSRDALEKYGTGSQASRLITGTFPIHEELESKLASFKGSESALVFGSGFLTNVGVVSALASRSDTIYADRLCHASIMDGIVLSRAKLKRFNHNDTSNLEDQIKSDKSAGKKIIITESVFSMDGDVAPLKEICYIAKRYNALMIVDEAHSTGIFGSLGSGLVSELNLKDSVNITMGTFSKAFGSYGGYVACSREMKNYLINKARSFVYTTSLPPAVIGSVLGTLDYLKENHDVGKSLLKNSQIFRELLQDSGLKTGDSKSQIIPVIVGDNSKAITFSKKLFENGIKVNAIRPPTVPEGTARLRFSITRAHSLEMLKDSANKIIAIAKELGII